MFPICSSIGDTPPEVKDFPDAVELPPIRGDVRFEKGVVIRGAVTITNPGPAPAVIKAGTVIDRDLVL